MELTFLGTGSGLPSKERNVTGLALSPDNSKSWYLIDCGEASQHQLQYTHLSLQNLQAIFITHLHGDHCYGLPGLLDSASMSGRTQKLPLIAPHAVWEWVVATQKMNQATLPFALEFIAVEDFNGWQDHAMQVDAIPLSHRVPSYAYAFTEITAPRLDSDKLRRDNIPQGPLWGALQHGRDVAWQNRSLRAQEYLLPALAARKIVVGGDNDQPNLLAQACAQAQVLVHEATYTQEIWNKVGPSVQHSSAAMVANFAQEIGLPNLVLTHFSPRYQANPNRSPSIHDIEQEACHHYHGNLYLADDLARFHLGKDGVLLRHKGS